MFFHPKNICPFYFNTQSDTSSAVHLNNVEHEHEHDKKCRIQKQAQKIKTNHLKLLETELYAARSSGQHRFVSFWLRLLICWRVSDHGNHLDLLLLCGLEDLVIRWWRVVAVGRRWWVWTHHVGCAGLTRVGRGQRHCHGNAGVTIALHSRLLRNWGEIKGLLVKMHNDT